MKRVAWIAGATALACGIALAADSARTVLAASADPDDETTTGPSIIKIPVEGVVAQITFEKGGRINVTSKGTPLRPGTYWVKSISLFKKDDKGRTWELRCTGTFGSLANITIAAGQEKVVLLGKTIALRVQAGPNEEGGISVRTGGAGQSGEYYHPGAFLNGKTVVLPTVVVKDAEGKPLASGRVAKASDGTIRFDCRLPPGYKGEYDVEVKAVMGPFEYKVAKTIEPLP
ncbi:MAG TPA: hypothetical protein VMZ92_20020 [Planctomycetota bacterium]|nr:hypothetical protein [Planctomycetota bacterium]